MLLGVNIDHIATLRAVRGVDYPDIATAVRAAEEGGADFITAHLREDRRHIRDEDIPVIMAACETWLNLEIAAAPEMVAFACEHKPRSACLVPERREELTTEGGLDAAGDSGRLAAAISQLKDADIEVSLFVEPDMRQLEAAAKAGADCVELHTGKYANLAAKGPKHAEAELARLADAAAAGKELGLKVNAGHGLTRANVGIVAAIPGISELNIGHSIIADAALAGLAYSVDAMRKDMGL